MDACASCGNALAPDLEWCPLCYAPVRTEAPQPVLRPGLAIRGIGATPAQLPAQEFSRWKGGPTSMGWLGRLGASIGVLILAALIYVYGFPVVIGATGPKYIALYLVFAGPVVLYLLSRLWRPSRIR